MNTMTRRSVIALAAVGAAAAVTPPSAPARAAVSRAPSTADWVAFAKGVDSPVYLPGTSQYVSHKAVFNTRFDGSAPAAVMRVKGQADIQAAMRFAADHSMQISPRSGGHSYVGASAANGTFVLDLRDYRGISYDTSSGLATVFAGADLYSVHDALARHGRTIPTGTCPTVGVAGLTLGGGVGPATREHGLTCDALESATVVLTDGRALRVSAQRYSDIFWALRGGGGGNVAFVTSLQFRTHAATSKGIFRLTFPSESAARTMVRWSAWQRRSAGYRWSNFHVDTDGSGIRPHVVGVCPAGDERAAAAALIAAAGVRPVREDYRQLSHMDSVRFLGGGTTSPRQAFVAGSDVLRTVEQGAAEVIVGTVQERARGGASGSAIVDPIDGAVRRLGVSDTAFPWREHTATVQWYVGRTGSSGTSWILNAHDALGDHSVGRYVNYLEAGDSPRLYYGANHDRLVALRRQYDPQRRLHSGVSF